MIYHGRCQRACSRDSRHLPARRFPSFLCLALMTLSATFFCCARSMPLYTTAVPPLLISFRTLENERTSASERRGVLGRAECRITYLYRPFPIILFSRPMTLALYCIESSRIFTYNYSWVHRRPRGWVEFGGYVSLEKSSVRRKTGSVSARRTYTRPVSKRRRVDEMRR